MPARRALGAGRKDDVGDITGVPDTVIQVADWKDALRAVREKPLECELQRETAAYNSWHAQGNPVSPDPTFAATFIRLRGGEYRVVMTPEQFAQLWKEAQ